MSTRARLVLLAIMLAACSALAEAQQQPQPQPPDPFQFNVPAAQTNVSGIAANAVRMLYAFRQEVERPLNDYFFMIAGAIFTLVSCFYFLKLCHEHGGMDFVLLGRFIARFAVFGFLLANVLFLMWGFGRVGQQLAYGSPGSVQMNGAPPSPSWLSRLASQRRQSFDLAYKRFTRGLFTVTVKGTPRDLTDPGDGTVTILGVTKNKGLSVDALAGAATGEGAWSDPVTWFKTVSWNRFFMECAGFFNTYAWHFVVIFLELMAAIAIAVGMDKGGLASRITKNWAWGFVAIALVMPSVSQILSIFAYTFGALALQIGDNYASMYYWDPNTLAVVRGQGPQQALSGEPWQMIAAGSIGMFLSACLMFSSIVIAYQITLGRVYETVSAGVGGWMSTAAASVIGLYSATTSASLGRQAEQMTLQGAHAAEGANFRAEHRAADKTVQGGAVASRASAEAGYVEKRADVEATRDASISRAGLGHWRGVQENEAKYQQTITESEARMKSGQVSADHARNKENEGLLGGSIANAAKGIARLDNDWGITRWWEGKDSKVIGEPSNPSAARPAAPQATAPSAGAPGPDDNSSSRSFLPPAGMPAGGGRFGAPRDYNRDGLFREKHGGEDYARAQGFGRGTVVGSESEGTVLWSGRNNAYGNRVFVERADGTVVAYSHLADESSRHLQPGVALKRGDVIGQVGNTGAASRGFHLHVDAGRLVGFGKDGEPVIARLDKSPSSQGIIPVRVSGDGLPNTVVDPNASMPTQTRQAMNRASEETERGVRSGAGAHADEMDRISYEALREEKHIAARMSQQILSGADQGRDRRLAGIKVQEALGYEANRIRHEGAQEASDLRFKFGMEAARIREAGQRAGSFGSVFAQQAGRIGEHFRY